MIGKRFGKWTVLRFSHQYDKYLYWECRCKCRKTRIIKENDLKSGCITFCRCKTAKNLQSRYDMHGKSSWPECKVWRGMKSRCNDKDNPNFVYYGGRGISVCKSWQKSFENFINDMGRRPSSDYSIDRIDNDGNYEPNNCRWATTAEQVNNRRNSRILAFDGKSLNVMQWSEITKTSYASIIERLNADWPIEQVLFASPEAYKIYQDSINEFKIDNSMIGKRFNKLVVLEFSHRDSKRQKYWKTVCDCGKIRVIGQNHLRGSIKSCKCLHIKKSKESRNKNRIVPKQKSKDLLSSRLNQKQKQLST